MLKNHSDPQLLQQTKTLSQKERTIISKVISHLEEINNRKLFVDLGYNSLLKFCVGELKNSESTAYRRIKTIKLARAVPEIKDELKSGALNIGQTSMAQGLLDGRKIDEERKKEFIEDIKNKTVKESEDLIREKLKLPKRKTYIKIEVSKETKARWNEAKARLAHLNLTDEQLLDNLLEEKFRSNKKNVREYRVSKKSLRQRHIPAKTRREVLAKANGQCEKCRSVYSLEMDHIRPIAQGGNSDISNLRLLCRNCNQRRAIKSL